MRTLTKSLPKAPGGPSLTRLAQSWLSRGRDVRAAERVEPGPAREARLDVTRRALAEGRAALVDAVAAHHGLPVGIATQGFIVVVGADTDGPGRGISVIAVPREAIRWTS